MKRSPYVFVLWQIHAIHIFSNSIPCVSVNEVLTEWNSIYFWTWHMPSSNKRTHLTEKYLSSKVTLSVAVLETWKYIACYFPYFQGELIVNIYLVQQKKKKLSWQTEWFFCMISAWTEPYLFGFKEICRRAFLQYGV